MDEFHKYLLISVVVGMFGILSTLGTYSELRRPLFGPFLLIIAGYYFFRAYKIAPPEGMSFDSVVQALMSFVSLFT